MSEATGLFTVTGVLGVVSTLTIVFGLTAMFVIVLYGLMQFIHQISIVYSWSTTVRYNKYPCGGTY